VPVVGHFGSGSDEDPAGYPNRRLVMLYAEHLKRSMDGLTSDAWEKLLRADPPVRPTPKTILTTCHCCRTPVTVEVSVALLPVLPPSVEPDDETPSDPTDDTRIELAAVTRTDFVLA
jgi:hypothetical protein